ncbi:uncharacterized protein AB675_8666 [Cyphellophora attinorum]|uniref:Uncharacterized protein n=1 Tax=Cyphellophora attinorum TaxID=1664694 RepID=A0A0N1P1A9_9EURO|nr:uncharacterized protein AB675_8666 [Phialophora attinorum]KPI44565.1 hypothetical protein AB675_8666 [Phialophora attinorum]
MAQGAIKAKPKPSSGAKSSKHTPSGITKKGSLQMNPRKARLQKQAKLSKKLTSGLTAQTERMLGEKAGHLELLGKGRDKSGGGAKGKEGGKAKGGGKGGKQGRKG